MDGETEMAADDTIPPLPPILLLLLLPHMICFLIFLSGGPCSGFGIEMAGETEMADNHFCPLTPILLLPHVFFSLFFFSSMSFLLHKQIGQLLLRLIPHLDVLLNIPFCRKLRLYLVFLYL